MSLLERERYLAKIKGVVHVCMSLYVIDEFIADNVHDFKIFFLFLQTAFRD